MYRSTMSIGRLDVSIGVLGPYEAQERGLPSWSLAVMQKQQDLQEHYQLAMGIHVALRGMEAKRAYAPNVAVASARIISPSELKTRIRLSSIDLYRNKDMPADGTFLDRNEAFVMSAAGCPVIIATAGDRLIVAHAGRDSLVDRRAVMGATPCREHLSVVHAIIEAFAKKGLAPETVKMCMQFAIPADVFEHRFDHPRYGTFNRALKKFVDKRWSGCTTEENGRMFLNLEFLFEEQAKQAGVRNVWAMNSLAVFPLLAHTHDGRDPQARNLFLVKREN